MNVTIKPGAATQDAVEIDKIVASIKEDMQILNDAIVDTIPELLQTEWSDKVRSDWEQYYVNDVAGAMDDMALSATNLRKALDEFLEYSKSE